MHPPARRPRAHHRVNPYPGARGQNETDMFSDHDETSPSIAAVSATAVNNNLFALRVLLPVSECRTRDASESGINVGTVAELCS